MSDNRASPVAPAPTHLSPHLDQNEAPPAAMDRGRRGPTGRKGYNEPQPSPSPTPSSRSGSAHGRSASIGHRRGHSNSSPLSPDFCSRSPSRGASPSPRSRSRGLTGRKGYNAENLEGRKGYNDSGSGSSPQPSPDLLDSVRRAQHSRSASAASGSDKHSPSPSRAKFSPDPQVDYSPRTRVGMGGRKGYNHIQTSTPMGRRPSDDGRVPQQQDPDDALGLGINRHDGLTGRKGYNSSARNASPSPLRR